MDETLIRLAGERALLQREAREKRAQLDGEREAVLRLVNRLPLGNADDDWLDGELARLRRVRAIQLELRAIEGRIAEITRQIGE